MVEINVHRTVNLVPFDWVAAEYPDYGTPGQCGKLYGTLLQFACPGCGRFGAIPCSRPKTDERPSWDIVAGSLDAPTELTLTPSIHCVGCCGWHGYLKAGIFEGI